MTLEHNAKERTIGCHCSPFEAGIDCTISQQQLCQNSAGLRTNTQTLPLISAQSAGVHNSLPLCLRLQKLQPLLQLLASACRPWGAHTAFTNRAGFVVRQIRQNHGEVELCTTAWAKMYEAIVTFDLLLAASGQLPKGNSSVGCLENGQPAVGTVHLCEAPGGFISATNHFIKTHR